MKQDILIMFGGVSSEHDVSLLSACAVIDNIDYDKFNVHKLGVTKKGDMYYYTGSNDAIKDSTWFEQTQYCIPCTISTNRLYKGLVLLECDKHTIINIDAVFSVIHGGNGEDGTLQGLLSFADIPMVGCDLTSSANCMDKGLTHILLDNAGVKTARYIAIRKYDYSQEKDCILKSIENDISYPCFVKPAKSGSSVGVSKANTKAGLEKAIETAFVYDSKVIVEEAIDGVELECSVLGNDELVASCIGEIEPCNDFYDYEAKYVNSTQTYIPARIDDDISKKLQELALKAYRTMECSGMARVDFFLTKAGDIYLNEINTIPGFTSISMYNQLLQASGIDFKTLITRLIDDSLSK